MTIIDVHNHYYPPEYIEALRLGNSTIRVEYDDAGNPVLLSPGDSNTAVRGHRDIPYRIGVLAQEGLTHQVISFSAPGTLLESPSRSTELAILVNNSLAAIKERYRASFIPLATLPLNDPNSSIRELERTVTMGFPGFMVFGNVLGVPLADQRFWPLWERANDSGSVIYIHPTFPVGVEAMESYWLMPLVGFMMDTTLAAAHLVFAGIPERFPKIRWVLGHLGGTIPYLAERLDRGYESFPTCRKNISSPPSCYLRNFFYDTVNFDPGALRLAVEFAGVSQLLAGSDYPHQIGSISKMISSIRGLGLSASDTSRILGGNAADLFGVKTG